MYLGALWVSYLFVALVLIHLWFLIAVGLATRKSTPLGRWEKWKLAGTVVALGAIWSPLVVAAIR